MLFLLTISLSGFQLAAQPPEQSPERQQIDAKRMDTDLNAPDALPRSREFIRIDSNYYVGWMYEGLYKARHAADLLGYKNAIPALRKALLLLEKDYSKQLRTRSGDLLQYFPAYRYQYDYSMIAASLMECYSNIELPERAFDIVMRVRQFNFQRHYFFPAYANAAWLVHRHRFYTTEQLNFLGNDIKENEQRAQAYLDSGLVKIEENSRINAGIFPDELNEEERQTIYHYKAILHGYAMHIDSALHYYRLMQEWPYFSYNNYANFLGIIGHFAEAEKNYENAAIQDAGDKRLQEWAYYGSVIEIYKGLPGKGALEMKDMIRAVGSTPGFGWYNIALARCLLYQGQTLESRRYADKASQFKELHIGTTLGQSHYEFSVNVLKLMATIREIEAVKFENKNWWFNLRDLARLGKLNLEKYLQQYLIITQLALNPEREEVIYPLFSTESTVSWDEIWYLIKDFSTNFFKDRFQERLNHDTRKRIRKYFSLFIAKLDQEQGNYQTALNRLNRINMENTDPEYEKLFLARYYEALALSQKKTNKDEAALQSRYQAYRLFPELGPFSKTTSAFRLTVLGNVDEDLIRRLKRCRIAFGTDSALPSITLHFSSSEAGKPQVIFYVQGPEGKTIVKRQTLLYTKSKKAAVELAYRLFNIERKSG